jgi:heptosyltransferase-2
MIGDAVMSLPFIRSAEQTFDVHVTCGEGSAGIFKLVMPEERIIPWTPPWMIEGGGMAKWRKAGLPQYVRKIRAVRADVAVSVWADPRVHTLMAMSGCKVRIGFPMTANNFYASHLPWRKKQIRIGAFITLAASLATMRPLLTKKVNRGEYYQHHVEDFQDLSRALGIAWDDRRPWLTLPAPFVPDLARGAGPPVWLVHPGARFEGRRWPLASFVKIIREVLLPAGARVLLVRAPELPEALPPLPDGVEVVAPAGLREFMDICATVDVVLCNETGVSHMGAALGKQIVFILSDTEPRWFAPRGSEQNAVSLNVCPHRPCLDRCVMPSYICLEAVTFEMVREKVQSMLAEFRTEAGRQ